MYKIKYILIIFLISTSFIIASGNKDMLELGTAVYCDLHYDDLINWLDMAQHWHTGVYQYFEYLPNGNGRIRYTIMKAYSPFSCEDCSQNHNVDYAISTTNTGSSLNILRDYFKADFNLYGYDFSHYHGAYSDNNISANKRSSIAGTANALGAASIDYTWSDMLDVNDTWCGWWWCEDWNGEIYRIDELRCDGVVEYSYEKNNVIVSKAYYDCNHVSYRDNIATPDIDNVDYHNILHDGVYACSDFLDGYKGELCPRIQAGENHRGSGTDRSYFDPLISSSPITSNFSRTQYSDKIQLNFKVRDNASVKAYVLVQVKKTNESTWRTLIDKNNKKWKFREVDLTDWNGSYQYDYFHIPWCGKYDGGYYAAGNGNFNLKITIIDQGANYSDSYYSFSGTIPSLSVTISGPSSLNRNQMGTFTAHPSCGVPPYHYSWQYFPYCNDVDGPILPDAPVCGNWYNFGGDNQTVTHGDYYNFSVKVTVTDAANSTATATKYVSVSGNNASQSNLGKVASTENVLPIETRLTDNYPNPFNPTTIINYQLKESGFIILKVYDILGKEVATLANENKTAGFYGVSFDASSLPSGLYIYRMTVNDYVETKKMLLTK